MAIEGKELREIRLEDIQSLIDNQVSEGITLEYKLKSWERNDEGTRELLRDISSFANARGGHILVGIAEDQDNEGIATQIVGVSDAEDEPQRIMNVCLSCIDERITGLDMIAIPVKANTKVIAIRVPRSLRTPHMITFKNLYQCWRRHGSRKSVMSIDEIRDACRAVEDIMKALGEFIDGRVQKFLNSHTQGPHLFVSACPMTIRDDLVDVFDPNLHKLLSRPPKVRRQRGSVDLFFGSHPEEPWKPTLYGIRACLGDRKQMEIMRNGYMELIAGRLLSDHRYTLDDLDRPILWDWMVAEYVVNFVLFTKEFIRYASLPVPMVFTIALSGINEAGLYERGIPQCDFPDYIPGTCKEGNHLMLPSMQVKSFTDPSKVAAVFVDRIWNAFGFKKAYFFEEEGKFTIPEVKI